MSERGEGKSSGKQAENALPRTKVGQTLLFRLRLETVDNNNQAVVHLEP